MITDAHCHLGPGLRASCQFGPLYEAETADVLLPILDRVAIHRAIVFAPNWEGGWNEDEFIDPNYERANEAVANAVRSFPERLIGFGRISPKFGRRAERELARCFADYGFFGLKLNNEADSFNPADLARVGPFFELCESHQAPVLVHTGFHPAQPMIFLPLAQRFPRVPLILGHLGGRIASDAIIVAENASNVFLETSGSIPMQLERVLKAIGPQRVIFGTDLPYNIPEIELNRIRNIGLDDAALEQVLHQNIEGLLRNVRT